MGEVIFRYDELVSVCVKNEHGGWETVRGVSSLGTLLYCTVLYCTVLLFTVVYIMFFCYCNSPIQI